VTNSGFVHSLDPSMLLDSEKLFPLLNWVPAPISECLFPGGDANRIANIARSRDSQADSFVNQPRHEPAPIGFFALRRTAHCPHCREFLARANVVDQTPNCFHASRTSSSGLRTPSFGSSGKNVCDGLGKPHDHPCDLRQDFCRSRAGARSRFARRQFSPRIFAQ